MKNSNFPSRAKSRPNELLEFFIHSRRELFCIRCVFKRRARAATQSRSFITISRYERRADLHKYANAGDPRDGSAVKASKCRRRRCRRRRRRRLFVRNALLPSELYTKSETQTSTDIKSNHHIVMCLLT